MVYVCVVVDVWSMCGVRGCVGVLWDARGWGTRGSSTDFLRERRGLTHISRLLKSTKWATG